MWENLHSFLQNSFRNTHGNRHLDLRSRLDSTLQHDFSDFKHHQAIMYDFITGCYNVNGSRFAQEGLRA